uniref:FBA_2 domain-containing protein n=1 Tax=Caenorhabditis tropicalis TaxID=1561998 RepID=A0A1I7TGA4_9PELO
MSLSYEPLQSVLTELSIEKRLDIVNNVPALQNIEKTVPLKLNTLTLKELEFSINEITHRLGLFTAWDKDREPKYVPFRLLQYDVDTYGFRCARKPTEQTRDEHRIDDRVDWRVVRRDEEIRKRIHRFMFTKLKESHLRNRAEEDEEDPELQRLEENLFPHHCRISETNPPFHIQMRYSVLNGNTVLRETNTAYKKSIHDAMRALAFKYFGGRANIHVDTFKIDATGFHRYPIEMKLLVKKMEISNADKVDLDSILPLLNPSCFPMRSIQTDGRKNSGASILQKCDELYLLKHPLNFLELKNRRVIFMEDSFPSSKIEEMLKDWLRKGREAGTHYTFKVNRSVPAMTMMAEFLDKPGARLRRLAEKRRMDVAYQIFVPISYTTEIKLFCKVGRETKKVQSFHIKVQRTY